MKKVLVILSACFAALLGCSNAYRGIYSIGNEAGSDAAIRQQQAAAVRDAVLRVADEVGFAVKQRVGSPTNSYLPGLDAIVSKEGLKAPYNALETGKVHVSLSVTFFYPFWIVITDDGNTSESEFVRRLRSRLEAELVNVRPTITVSFRRDWTRLE